MAFIRLEDEAGNRLLEEDGTEVEEIFIPDEDLKEIEEEARSRGITVEDMFLEILTDAAHNAGLTD